MNHPWRFGRVALMALMTALTLTACGSNEDSPEAAPGNEPGQPFTVMLNWTPNAHHLGLYVAHERGWYAEAGLDVRIVQPGSDGALFALAAGEADVAVSVAEAILPARAAGLPVVSVAAIVPSNDSSLMALADHGIERPRDLEGRRYGGYGGALEIELISRLVTCDGGDPDAVTTIEIGDVDYLVGMDQGLYDVVWVFSGWDGVRATEVEGRAISEIRFDDYFDCIPDWYTPLLAANEETLTGPGREALATFLEITRRGYEAAIDDPPAAAADLLAGAPETDEALIRAAADYYAPRFTAPGRPWGYQDEQIWRAFATFALDAGLIDEPIEVGSAFTTDLAN